MIEDGLKSRTKMQAHHQNFVDTAEAMPVPRATDANHRTDQNYYESNLTEPRGLLFESVLKRRGDDSEPSDEDCDFDEIPEAESPSRQSSDAVIIESASGTARKEFLLLDNKQPQKTEKANKNRQA